MNFLTCTVKKCRYRLNRRLPRNVTLYMLPRNAPEELKEQWKEVCTGRLVACSEHFMDSDFIRRKTSPESRDKFKPLKQNVVPKINLSKKKIVQEVLGSSGKPENRKDEGIIILNDSPMGPMKDSAQLTDPLADVPDDIVQEVQEPENTANAIDCRISEPPRRNHLNSIYDKVILKEDGQRIPIHRGPIEARLVSKPPTTEISSPNPDVHSQVMPGKPLPTKSPDDEKKGPKVVIRQVKLARKKFGDALARQKIINDMEVDRFLQRKDQQKPGNIPESVKNLIENDWTTSSEKSHEKSSENTQESSHSSESSRKRRRKQVFHPDRDKLASEEDSKTPEKPEEPPEKLLRTTEDDDDVIFLPQKIDVIDVEDDSDTEPSNQPTGFKCDSKCEYKSKILEDNKKISSLVALKEKLESRKKLLQTNNEKFYARHMAAQEFLEAVPSILSETQKDIIFGTSDPVVWQADEIRNALVLKNLSEDLYTYLRQVLNYPLPTLESLLVWELDYPHEAIRARTVAREYEQEAEYDLVEDEVDEEAENIMLLSQVSVEIKEEDPLKK